MADTSISRPTTTGEIVELIDAARSGRTQLAMRGGGSKAGFGAPELATVVDMRGFAGVVDYDPAELVLTVRPGTPLTEANAAASTRVKWFESHP